MSKKRPDALGLWLPFAKKVLKEIASKTIIFNTSYCRGPEISHSVNLYNTLIFQCQNANTEAGHLDSLIYFSLFYSLLLLHVL